MEIAGAREYMDCVVSNPEADTFNRQKNLQKPASGAAHKPPVNPSYFFPRHVPKRTVFSANAVNLQSYTPKKF